MSTHQDRLRRYGFAVLTLAVGAAVMAIPEIRDGAGTPILVYFFVVLLSSWYGGLGPGLFTTAVIVLATSHTTFPYWRIVRLGLGIASGVSISALAEVLHAARRRAERNEQRLRALVEKGWDVISVVSADGVVQYASPNVAHTLGHAPEDFVGRAALELIHPDDRERVGRLLGELRVEPGASRGVEYRVRDKQCTWRWLEGTVTNLLADPAVGGLVCNFRDITGRKRADEAQRLLAEAGAVLSSSLDAGATLDALSRLAVPRLADLCVIDMVQDDGQVLRAAVAHADPAKQPLADELRRYPPLLGSSHPAMRALRSGRAEITDPVDDASLAANARNSAHLEVVRQLGYSSYLCMPLTARGRGAGRLYADRHARASRLRRGRPGAGRGIGPPRRAGRGQRPAVPRGRAGAAGGRGGRPRQRAVPGRPQPRTAEPAVPCADGRLGAARRRSDGSVCAQRCK